MASEETHSAVDEHTEARSPPKSEVSSSLPSLISLVIFFLFTIFLPLESTEVCIWISVEVTSPLGLYSSIVVSSTSYIFFLDDFFFGFSSGLGKSFCLISSSSLFISGNSGFPTLKDYKVK
uniref:Transmembrane protein n=1 Tax=Cacopsylla melanoneura TaxID=428564 RepID=A0A8D9EIR7_9HEMI